MAYIELITDINAPVEECFNLARNIDLHQNSMRYTGEQAIAGTSHGLITLGESVTWRARHFGLWFKMTVKITELNYATAFVDQQLKGPFKILRHRHIFKFITASKTQMIDEFTFQSPWGILGKWVDKKILKPYLHKLLQQRNAFIKARAENHQQNGKLNCTTIA